MGEKTDAATAGVRTSPELEVYTSGLQIKSIPISFMEAKALTPGSLKAEFFKMLAFCHCIRASAMSF